MSQIDYSKRCRGIGHVPACVVAGSGAQGRDLREGFDALIYLEGLSVV